jgi:hypothetical protein
MTRSGSKHEGERRHEPPRPSASAEELALRWEESQPVDPQEPTSTAAGRPSVPRRPGDRRSASADAAALRWQERHPDDEED